MNYYKLYIMQLHAIVKNFFLLFKKAEFLQIFALLIKSSFTFADNFLHFFDILIIEFDTI